MKHKNRLLRLLPIMAATVSLMLLSCGKNAGDSQEQVIEALDDSLARVSPSVPKMVAGAQRSATDSLSYYEYGIRLGRYYIVTGDIRRADSIISQALHFLKAQEESPHVSSVLGYAYNSAAIVSHNFHQQPEETRRNFMLAYQALMNSDHKEMTSDVCANIADSYALSDSLPQAANWYRRALFLVDSLQLPAERNITLYMGLGRVYQMLDDYDTALRYLTASEKQLGKMSHEMQAYLLNTLGNFYYYTKDYPKALREFRRMERLLSGSEMKENFSTYACKLNLADVLLNTDSIKEAKKCLGEAEQFFSQHADSTVAYYIHSVRLGIAVREGDMTAARHLAEMQDEPSSVEHGLRDIRNRYLREYYEKAGNFRAALQNLKAEQQETEKQVHDRQHMIAAEVMTRFAQDTLQLHHKIAMQQKEAAVSEAHNMIAGTVAAVILLILTIGFGMMYIHRKRLITKMSIMKLRMENARNRISPHFVFNVLNSRITSTGREETDELTLLSRLIRTNLDITSKEVISLGEEMAFVDNYIEVERRIMDNGLEYRKTLNAAADEAFLGSFMIPPTLVQILAENSLKHALRGKEGHKLLTIGIEATREGGVTITVTDNGPGFDIRAAEGKQGHGLRILRATIHMFNQRSKRKISFTLKNLTDDGGRTTGCRATLHFPNSLKEL